MPSLDVAAERAALEAERAALAAEREALAAERTGLRHRSTHKPEAGQISILPGIEKTIKRQGTGPLPEAGQLVHISYIMRLSDGKAVDISGQTATLTKDHPTLVQSFNLGEKPLRLPAFIDKAVASMQAGEVRAIGAT